MITSLSGSFSGLIAYRDNSNKPFRGTFDSRFQEFDQFGLSAAIDALSDVNVAHDVTTYLPLAGSFVGIPSGSVVAVHSSNTFTLTIDGEGYFQILNPDDGVVYYTRNLLMTVGAGDIFSFGNYQIQPMITLPPGTAQFFIGGDGLVSITLDSDPNNLILVGQIQTATFTSAPTSIGNGVFTEGSSSPIIGTPGDPGFGLLKQSFVEQVNTARGDIANVVLRIDATFTRDNGPQGTFAIVYESGHARLIGSLADISVLRTDNQGYLAKFNTILQNATGDDNLEVQ